MSRPSLGVHWLLVMLGTPVALRDIRCVERFVHAAINKTRLHLTADQREELHAEGLAILYRMESRYRDTGGNFAGYANAYLPGKLITAWHRSHPNHHEYRDLEGKLRWGQHPEPLSIQGLIAERASEAERPDSFDANDPWMMRGIRGHFDWLPQPSAGLAKAA